MSESPRNLQWIETRKQKVFRLLIPRKVQHPRHPGETVKRYTTPPAATAAETAWNSRVANHRSTLPSPLKVRKGAFYNGFTGPVPMDSAPSPLPLYLHIGNAPGASAVGLVASAEVPPVRDVQPKVERKSAFLGRRVSHGEDAAGVRGEELAAEPHAADGIPDVCDPRLEIDRANVVRRV